MRSLSQSGRFRRGAARAGRRRRCGICDKSEHAPKSGCDRERRRRRGERDEHPEHVVSPPFFACVRLCHVSPRAGRFRYWCTGMADRFYRRDLGLGGELHGLYWGRDDDGDLAYVDVRASEWVKDGTLLLDFLDPGTDPLEQITQEEAMQVAATYGVDLYAPSVRERRSATTGSALSSSRRVPCVDRADTRCHDDAGTRRVHNSAEQRRGTPNNT
jgi:hypothetical protein